MISHVSRCLPRALAGTLLCVAALVLSGCMGGGTHLQRPAASIQQLTLQSNGEWSAVVRFQNNSYDTGMHVYSIDATLDLDGKPAGHIAVSPGIDIPAMDADIATATLRPDAAGSAALKAAGKNAIQYQLKGTLTIGKSGENKPEPFTLDHRGYISPVPGVSNIWR